MPRLIIEPEAEADIAQARDGYEQQRAGLGDDFDLNCAWMPVFKMCRDIHGRSRKFTNKFGDS